MCVSALIGPVSLFVQDVRNPVGRPYLAVVRVPAELEIDTTPFRLFQVIGLMVEEDGEQRVGRDQIRQRTARSVAPIVATDDPNP